LARRRDQEVVAEIQRWMRKPTSLAFEAPLSAGNTCSIKYSLAPKSRERLRMSATTAFTATIVALPPSTTVRYRLACDTWKGPIMLQATTLAAVGPPPSPPVVVAATRVGDRVTFELTSDPSEPTVGWIEFGSDACFDDVTGVFAQKQISIVNAKIDRLGVRNSGCTVFSAVVP
jgi:hypothetical protein